MLGKGGVRQGGGGVLGKGRVLGKGGLGKGRVLGKGGGVRQGEGGQSSPTHRYNYHTT